MNTAIGHCPGALQDHKKNDFWEARKTSCFLDGFFIENGLLLEAIFNEKNHVKINADFEPEKVMIFDEKSMQKLLEFLHIFFICLVRFRKVPNAKYCIKTNEFSMFSGFAQFGKQLKNS